MESFARISQEVFRDYVRSAVIIDDQWPEHEVVVSDDKIGESDLLAGATEEDEISVADTDLSGDAPMPLMASTAANVDAEILGRLRRALLSEGILTCGLRYQQTERITAIKLALRADIVVLDWHLVGDDGAEALEILRPLLGDCLRFVCIWTGRGRAGEVRERLIRDLRPSGSRQYDTPADVREADLRLGNLVIAIRVKEGLEDEPELAVGPERFLEVAAQGLASSFGGLVQLAMLEMTSQHREHLPEILEHIGGSIDTAVLFEAGDKNSPVGPGGAFLGVLIDEWRSRLEQGSAQLRSLSTEGRRAFGAKLRSAQSEDWPKDMSSMLETFGTKAGVAKKCSEAMVSEVPIWLEDGCEKELPATDVSPRIAAWAALQAASKGNKSLAPLLQLDALFHQQFNAVTSLTQGTVVKIQEGEVAHHLICTTPLCDAERPDKIGRLFSFVQTRIVPEEKVLQYGGSENYCIINQGDVYLCLAVLVKERVSLEIADPRFDDNGIVHAQLSLGGRQERSPGTREIIKLQRIAQLRREHALSLTAVTAADASRIGVNKVELIRTRINPRRKP